MLGKAPVNWGLLLCSRFADALPKVGERLLAGGLVGGFQLASLLSRMALTRLLRLCLDVNEEPISVASLADSNVARTLFILKGEHEQSDQLLFTQLRGAVARIGERPVPPAGPQYHYPASYPGSDS